MMSTELVVAIVGGLFTLIMVFFGFILNGMRSVIEGATKNLEKVAEDLQQLNNSVLGQYITRDSSESKWAAQRILDHELRSMIQVNMVDIAKLQGIPYNYQRPTPPGVTD